MKQIVKNDNRMSLMGHLSELRRCLIRSVIFIAIGTVIGFIFSKPLFELLAEPIYRHFGTDNYFIATEPIEPFLAYMKIGLFAGFFMALPLLFYQLWIFISPALHRQEKIGAVFFVLFTSGFFIGGACFGYFVVLPTSVGFFLNLLEGTSIQYLPQMKAFLSFAIRLLFAFGLVFELPVILFLLTRFGFVTLQQLKQIRPYVVIAIFIVGGLLTGPDVASQLLMALPLWVLYELSIFVIRMIKLSK